MMRRRADLVLRRMGRRYMMVDAGQDSAGTSDVYTLNETAARLWERMGSDDICAEALAEWLSHEYEVDYEQALTDVRHQLDEWSQYGLIG